jgi:hypothetical protein
MRFSFTKRDSWVTNGTLALHFTMKKYRNVVQIVGYIKYLLLNDKYKMKCERR